MSQSPASAETIAPAAPRVSVGLPVYNGGKYVARAIDSVLRQTFADFELVISDNGSTDDTESICQTYAARDQRIRYFRAPANEGVVRNFNRCVELARGEYVHWQAADDMLAPTFLEQLVAVLDADPSVVLAFARTQMIDDDDHPIGWHDYDASASDPRPARRFANLINLNHRRHAAGEVYGLIRLPVLRQTSLYEPVVRTDSILLARLALAGRFHRIDQVLFLNRAHVERSIGLVPGTRAAPRSRLSRWIGTGPIPPPQFWNPSLAGRIVFPEWRILGEYMRSVREAPLTPAEQFRCWAILAGFAIRNIPKLARDVIIAAEHALLGRPGK
jgi:glycosyltransferase involved in cell wall biosynthesis